MASPCDLVGEDSEVGDDILTAGSLRSRARLRLRNPCLRRDGYKCVITGFYDDACAGSGSLVGAPDDALTADLEVAHIIPSQMGDAEV